MREVVARLFTCLRAGGRLQIRIAVIGGNAPRLEIIGVNTLPTSSSPATAYTNLSSCYSVACRDRLESLLDRLENLPCDRPEELRGIRAIGAGVVRRRGRSRSIPSSASNGHQGSSKCLYRAYSEYSHSRMATAQYSISIQPFGVSLFRNRPSDS